MDATRAVEAQRALHTAFQLHKRGGGRSAIAHHVDVVLLGAGTIGRELITQLMDRRGNADGRLRICAVVDRSGFVFAGGGLPRRRLLEVQRHKQRGMQLAAVAEGVAAFLEKRDPAVPLRVGAGMARPAAARTCSAAARPLVSIEPTPLNMLPVSAIMSEKNASETLRRSPSALAYTLGVMI